MNQLSPTDVPYRRRVSPLGSYGRAVSTLLLVVAIVLLEYRRIFKDLIHWVRVYAPPGTTLAELRQRLYDSPIDYHADGTLIQEYVDLAGELLLNPFVFPVIVSMGIVSIALEVRARRAD